jgi:hypothetical protein
MSNTSVKVAIAMFMVLAAPAASFARGGGSGHSGGVRANPGLIGAAESQVTNPSGMGNASRIAPVPPPSMAVPTVPQFK